MEAIAIVSRKGGVGKTATAHALGAGLRQQGKKVLYIDLDSQANLTYALGADPGDLDGMDLLMKQAATQDVILHTDQGDLIPGSEALAGADTLIQDTGKEYRLKEGLSSVVDMYDYAIIDTPAQLSTLTVNALTASNYAIIPVHAEIYSLQGIGLLNKTIEAVKRYCNKDLYIKGILITRYNPRTIISRDMQSNLQDIAKQLNTCLFNTAIRDCISIREAQACQQDIFTYAPRSNAAIDYADFIHEFTEGGRPTWQRRTSSKTQRSYF